MGWNAGVCGRSMKIDHFCMVEMKGEQSMIEDGEEQNKRPERKRTGDKTRRGEDETMYIEKRYKFSQDR